MKDTFSDESQYSYFQFHKDFKYPVIIKLDLESFDPNFSNILTNLGFIESTKPEKRKPREKKSLFNIFTKNQIKDPYSEEILLFINEASPKVSAQMGSLNENGSQFGSEKITPKGNYNVYCYQGKALMIYSKAINQWELGLHSGCGKPQDAAIIQIILIRFLSLALSTYGIVGLWGIPSSGGVIAMKLRESKGQAFFIDPKNNLIIFPNKTSKWANLPIIDGNDSTLNGDRIKMSKEELLCFLFARCTFFDYGNYPSLLNKSLIQISKFSQGIRQTPQKFLSRSNLSY